jgi:CheY-like chemotaxis protein
MEPNCSVLIVDDDPDDVFLLKHALRAASASSGHVTRVGTAGNGLEALDLLDKLDGQRQLPDVITVDLNMPVLDGLGFLRGLRNAPRLSGLKAIVVTTSADRVIHDDAIRAGADEIFVKPHTEAEFIRIAARILTNCPC